MHTAGSKIQNRSYHNLPRRWNVGLKPWCAFIRVAAAPRKLRKHLPERVEAEFRVFLPQTRTASGSVSPFFACLNASVVTVRCDTLQFYRLGSLPEVGYIPTLHSPIPATLLMCTGSELVSPAISRNLHMLEITLRLWEIVGDCNLKTRRCKRVAECGE